MSKRTEYLCILNIWYEVLPQGEINEELEGILPDMSKGISDIAMPFEKFPVSLLKKAQMSYTNIPADWDLKSMNHIIVAEDELIGYAHVDIEGGLVTPWAHISIYKKYGQYRYNLLIKDLSTKDISIHWQEVNYKKRG